MTAPSAREAKAADPSLPRGRTVHAEHRPYVVLEGDVRARLRELPDESVQVVVTSIPYFGLRAYGTTPQVWGGREDCPHEWRAAGESHGAGTFCIHCDAWFGELGLEPTPDLYVEHVVMVFREVRRVLRKDGTLWLNVGDSYATGAGRVGDRPGGGAQGDAWAARGVMTPPNRMPLPGLKPKDLIGIPWMVARALQRDGAHDPRTMDVVERIRRALLADHEEWDRVPPETRRVLDDLDAQWREAQRGGWWLRADCIWHKPNPMPSSATDRPTIAHEYLFLFAKSERYYYDAHAVRRPAGHHMLRDKRDPAKAPRIERGQAKGSKTRGAHPLGSVEAGANEVSVWTITTKPSTWDYCLHCDTYYDGSKRRRIRTYIVDADGQRRECPEGWWEEQQEDAEELDEGERVVRECRTCRRTDGWVDHFAVFPPDLPERCILASTSAHGACSMCGAPYERLLGEKVPTGAPGAGNKARKYDDAVGRPESHLGRGVPWTPATQATRGWAPTCACAASQPPPPVPCVVLDPFAGSGTTLAVAVNHGRRAIGIELNPSFAALSRRRIEKDAPAAASARLDHFTKEEPEDDEPQPA